MKPLWAWAVERIVFTVCWYKCVSMFSAFDWDDVLGWVSLMVKCIFGLGYLIGVFWKCICCFLFRRFLKGSYNDKSKCIIQTVNFVPFLALYVAPLALSIPLNYPNVSKSNKFNVMQRHYHWIIKQCKLVHRYTRRRCLYLKDTAFKMDCLNQWDMIWLELHGAHSVALLPQQKVPGLRLA